MIRIKRSFCCICILIISMVGNCIAEEIKNWEYKSSEVKIIEVAMETGPIEVIAEGDLVKVERIGEYDAEKCEISVEMKNRKLKLSIKSPKKWIKLFGKSECKAGFKISAPKDKKLILKSIGGSINVKDFSNGGKINSVAGTIDIENIGGKLKIRSEAGYIRGFVLSKNVDIKTKGAIIDLKWNKSPKKGKISIITEVGNAKLAFPKETKMGIHYKSGSGSFNSEFGSDLKAGFKIDCKSGSGSLNIKKS